MAIVTHHPILKGLSGRVGDVVYRQRNGQTIACKRPRPSQQPPTAAQQEMRHRFRMAVVLAKAVIADPVRKAQVATRCRPGQSVFNRALSEEMKRLIGQPMGVKEMKKKDKKTKGSAGLQAEPASATMSVVTRQSKPDTWHGDRIGRFIHGSGNYPPHQFNHPSGSTQGWWGASVMAGPG